MMVICCFECLFEFHNHFFILNSRDFRTEFLYIVNRIIKEYIMDVTHGIKYLLWILDNLCESISNTGAIILRVIKAIEFLKVCLIGLIKISLDVGKVNNVAVTIVFIRSVYAGKCLKEVVVLELTPEV